MRGALCAGLLLAWAAAAAAAGVPEPPKWSAEGPVSAGAPDRLSEARRTAELATLYGTKPELVRSLRTLGLDWVDAECAVAISTKAQRPVIEVLDLRAAGMEWGQVAKAYGFMLSDAVLGEGRLRDAPAALPGRRKAAPKPPAGKKKTESPSRKSSPP